MSKLAIIEELDELQKLMSKAAEISLNPPTRILPPICKVGLRHGEPCFVKSSGWPLKLDEIKYNINAIKEFLKAFPDIYRELQECLKKVEEKARAIRSSLEELKEELSPILVLNEICEAVS